ncbi:hypothetical protein acsn021_17340 [Anaerocolumna cellulosilytica]|uniref:Uncharacterized protein n=1 Tax=Anaerocolumna cellulosilytica TaxID=433286 RepID=A0A6S6R3X1_9FIRM|nr:hypothetical protein [Anaerocolumna cellulosilytica]MBB5194872.1 hypothetical protein [Anaerocolumna cellulosilytica]BCJ94165.1 hypothetical protein acsn021_17340 [Anaerocolumna cellulosilytica]
MKTILKAMRMKKIGIPDDLLYIFEGIIQSYNGDECDVKFIEAMNQHLTEEQRFQLWESDGGCKGTGYDKERKAFAIEHADKPISERLELYIAQMKKNSHNKIVLNDNNTITVNFTCDGCCKNVEKETFSQAPASFYGRCAGGRLYEYQKALGIKLKIKSIDVSPLGVNIENPCVFTFDIVE